MRRLVVAVALTLAACTSDSGSGGGAVTTTGPSTTTTLAAAAQLAYESCAAPYRAAQFGIELEVAMEHESVDAETARLAAAQVLAATLADQAAEIDAGFTGFASASALVRDRSLVGPGAPLDDAQLDEALRIRTATCTDVGLPNDETIVDVDHEARFEDTAERGRFDACADLIFGDDGSVLVQGERLTFADCDVVTAPALEADDAASAYREAVTLFLAATGGYVCSAEECRDEQDFSG